MGGRRACYACFVLSEAEGLSVVDERRAETAISVARYQADSEGENLAILLVAKLLPLPGG